MQRKQRVRINSSLSEWMNVESGIAQGSILVPLLFIIYIWDLYVDDLMCPNIITKVLKYIDDTKFIGKICNENEFSMYQDALENIYEWQRINNMMWNSTKFVRLSMGPNEEVKDLSLFTPGYENIVESKEKAKDLGILIDNDAKFASQRSKAITKTNNKCSWILRTFRTREINHLRTLWNTLAPSGLCGPAVGRSW